MPAPLKSGEVARRAGLILKTVRFDGDAGRIHLICRSEGGSLLFGEEVFAELTLIRILEFRRLGICTCAFLQATIRCKAGEIEQTIDALRHLHHELNVLLSSWEDCGDRKPSAT